MVSCARCLPNSYWTARFAACLGSRWNPIPGTSWCPAPNNSCPTFFCSEGAPEISQLRSGWNAVRKSLRPEGTTEKHNPPSLAGRIYFVRRHQPLRSWLISHVAPRHCPAVSLFHHLELETGNLKLFNSAWTQGKRSSRLISSSTSGRCAPGCCWNISATRPKFFAASKSELLRVRNIGDETAAAIAGWEKTVDLAGELKRISGIRLPRFDSNRRGLSRLAPANLRPAAGALRQGRADREGQKRRGHGRLAHDDALRHRDRAQAGVSTGLRGRDGRERRRARD